MQVEKHFKWIWADHGDDISRQYAGTGALKSGFTRTGKCRHKLVPLANASCMSNLVGMASGWSIVAACNVGWRAWSAQECRLPEKAVWLQASAPLVVWLTME